MTRIVVQAPLPDVMQLYSRNGLTKPLEFKAALLQAARGESVGIYAGDQIVAAVILYPVAPGEYEAAFACLPAAVHHLVPIFHAARSIRARLAETGRFTVRAHVRAGHEPGRRLARLCRMTLIGSDDGYEIWQWSC